MTTTSYCTRCGALVVRDELGRWVSLGWNQTLDRSTPPTARASEVCVVTQEFHRPEAAEDYRGPRDFAVEEDDVAGIGWTPGMRHPLG